jgi:hypothetical protein
LLTPPSAAWFPCFVETIMGHVPLNAQQAVSFYCGNSKSSEQKADTMVTAFIQTSGQNRIPKKWGLSG